MKLLDLEPKWLNENLFVFRCPHCKSDWLSCKNKVMPRSEQRALFEKEFGDEWFVIVVASNQDTAWNIEGDFENMSVTPSIDASQSGHWHGFITNGECI